MINDVSCKPPRPERHIGDGVFVSFDEANQLVLRVPAPASRDGREQRIYLNAEVWDALKYYAREIYGQK